MATIDVSSQMGHFQMIDAIGRVESDQIVATVCFNRVLPFAGLEAMAQLAAMHVRHNCDFARHAYLLKVIRCRELPEQELNGRFRLMARQSSHSQNVFRYTVTAKGRGGGQFSSELLIGLRDYDDQFQGRYLQAHYQKRFAGLCRLNS